MNLEDLLNKTCVIGLSYLDSDQQLLKQSLLAGSVEAVDEENGITIKLIQQTSDSAEGVFTLPSSLAPWFNAPKGVYRDENNQVLITDPNYLVTWDIHRTQNNQTEGDHEWWNWVPRTTPPSVG